MPGVPGDIGIVGEFGGYLCRRVSGTYYSYRRIAEGFRTGIIRGMPLGAVKRAWVMRNKRARPGSSGSDDVCCGPGLPASKNLVAVVFSFYLSTCTGRSTGTR